MNELSALLGDQNHDGGWGYHQVGSATEPTMFALLALCVSGRKHTPAAQRGIQWLKAIQRADGGWPPYHGVPQSTWVTALPLLLPESLRLQLATDRARRWLLSQQGRESTWEERIRNRLLRVNPLDTSQEGWPFYPNTAAWVSPTAFTVLGLERFPDHAQAKMRCESGREFLLSRKCSDGGWNHGSFKALGYDLPSYPETTGVALIGLHTRKGPKLEASIAKLIKTLHEVQSREARCWMQLGLLSQGIPAPLTLENVRPAKTNMERSLTILADAASEGNNILIGEHNNA